MDIAHQAKSRSTCDRKRVGAVLVRDRMILSTGYNGSVRGMPHCDEAGHMMEDGHCIATVHAEANAVLQAARNGVAIDGATVYTTASPCWACFKLLANAGVVRIVYDEFYREDRVFPVAKRLGIELIRLDEAERISRGDSPRRRGSGRTPPRSAPSKSRTRSGPIRRP
jgi:dCMP deaminase